MAQWLCSLSLSFLVCEIGMGCVLLEMCEFSWGTLKKNLIILDRAPTTEQSGQVEVSKAVSVLGLLTGT